MPLNKITTTTGAMLTATLVIAAAAVLMFPLSPQAQAQRQQIDTVDEIVHEATGGAASENDVRFHQALCTVGISSTALDSLGGCDALPPIGSSD
jgi:hypothetical protein